MGWVEQAVVRVEGLAAAVGLAAVETADLAAVPVDQERVCLV